MKEHAKKQRERISTVTTHTSVVGIYKGLNFSLDEQNRQVSRLFSTVLYFSTMPRELGARSPRFLLQALIQHPGMVLSQIRL